MRIDGSPAAQRHEAFEGFVETIAALRAPGGCPWDREQTHRSISNNMIEEAYEAVDAIESDDPVHLREELGDVLLQVVLQAQIASDAGEFTIDDVCADVDAKIIRRHPHVFGEASAEDAGAVLELWDRVKLAERAAIGEAAGGEAGGEAGAPDGAASAPGTPGAPDAGMRPAGLLDGIPRTFPALMEAQKISRKAVSVGFEWDSIDDVWASVEDEIAELKEAFAAAPKNSKGKIDASTPEGEAAKHAAELEFGDVLFTVVNVARHMGLDAESSLRATNAKFRERWAAMEAYARSAGRDVADYTTAEQNDLWNRAKKELAEPAR